ncbi:hypothetical protein Bresa_01034|uniref:Uncharacterized protein n=1 Tax=Brenneria salicis ATCC 15712 = DSM 30166 TaxID=714314 RepID=A0A366HY46_9GAMM|nr:hypothetical protein [Brenneria salicis ATCC 15712 = DSM 30166]RBP57632.1 hypothetical protein DES54_16227 [Brenneria salicis ATCC 15712 = DSM 30166]
MTNDHELHVRELTPAEIEALRQEMRQVIEWAKTELARRSKAPKCTMYIISNCE